MHTRERLDFVTVAYDPELPLLRLQARSLEIYLDRNCVNRILIVVNERDPGNTLARIRDDVMPEYGSLAQRVELMPASELLDDNDFKTSGWKRQQSIKLLAARFLSSEHYVVLDCKNHFIRHVDLCTFIAPDGRMRSTSVNSHGPRQKRLDLACRYFGVHDIPRDRLIPITTPFVLSRTDITDMLALIEEREGKQFTRFFHPAGFDYTEFFMIYAYTLMRYGSIEKVYELGLLFSIVFWERNPRGEKLKESLATARNSPGIYSLATHIRRMRTISRHDADALASAWVEFGLFPSKKSAVKFLNRMKPPGRLKTMMNILFEHGIRRP